MSYVCREMSIENAVADFFNVIDHIWQINFLYNNNKEKIIDGIKKNVRSLFVVEVIWDNWYDDSELSCLPMSLKQWYRYAENRPWRYYLCDFGAHKTFSIGAFGWSWPRQNDAEFEDIISDPCMQDRVMKTSVELKDILDYFSSHATRQR